MSDVWEANDLPKEPEIELSKAISAKRTADALEAIAQTLKETAGEIAHPEWGIAPTLRNMARG